MKEIVIPPNRRLLLRIVDRTAEATLLAAIAAQTVLALHLCLGG